MPWTRLFVLVSALTLAACASDPADTPSPCDTCTADELCVAAYDGTCNELGVVCKPRTPACPAATCSLACAPYLCGTGTDAGTGPTLSCGTTHCTGKTPIPGAFGCYGP
jgi:hypothetical protein